MRQKHARADVLAMTARKRRTRSGSARRRAEYGGVSRSTAQRGAPRWTGSHYVAVEQAGELLSLRISGPIRIDLSRADAMALAEVLLRAASRR